MAYSYNYCGFDIIHRNVFLFKTQRFGDWMLSPEPYRLGPTEWAFA
jgi:hypothetical protein